MAMKRQAGASLSGGPATTLPRRLAALAFFTGFPGFIGKRLVRRLLADDSELRVAALVEPKMEEAARKAAADIEGGDRIEILTGDIGERGRGLSGGQPERLRQEVTVASPLAAIYNLAVPFEIAQRV